MEDNKLLKKFAREIIKLHNEGEDGRFPCNCSLCKAATKELEKKKSGK